MPKDISVNQYVGDLLRASILARTEDEEDGVRLFGTQEIARRYHWNTPSLLVDCLNLQRGQ